MKITRCTLLAAALLGMANQSAESQGINPTVSTLKNSNIPRSSQTILSTSLGRSVTLTILLPPRYDEAINQRYPVLYLNDGQDIEALGLEGTLNRLYAEKQLTPLIVVGIHANQDRIHEYGTAAQADYKGRGSRAAQHSDFVLHELIPTIQKDYRVRTGPAYTAFAGFSLGGLSALDIAWHHSETFGKVGVFSGALWWRKRAYENGYDDHQDRIMHVQVREGTFKPGLNFWFQAGTEDEKDDRNGNGVIDAIDDTLDLMHELEVKGYRRNVDFRYVEVAGGHHNPETWGRAMPQFLTWAFGK